MNVSLDNLRDVATKPKWAHSGVGKTLETAERAAEILNSPEYRALADKTDVDEAKREPPQTHREPTLDIRAAEPNPGILDDHLKTQIQEPKHEVQVLVPAGEHVLQTVPLETTKSSEEAPEAELDEAIQKVEEEAMKAEESKEEAEINAVDQMVDEAAELGGEPIEFDGLSDTTATPSLVVEESKDVSDVPAEELFPTPIETASPVSEAQPLATEEAKEITEATSAQDSLAEPSETAPPAREEEPRPEAVSLDNTTQATPEVIEAQKAEAGVETEVRKVAEETAVDGTTREDVGEPKPEKKD